MRLWQAVEQYWRAALREVSTYTRSQRSARHTPSRAFGLLGAALAAGGTGAGLIAAALGRSDLRLLFVADALTCLACALVLRLALPADRPHLAPSGPGGRPEPVRPWRDRALWAMFLAGSAFALVSMQIVVALPLGLARSGFEPADGGLLFTVSALTAVTAQPALRLRRLAALSASTALALGYALMAIGLAGYAVAHTLSGFVVATAVWSLGDVLVLGRAFGVVAGLAPPGGTDRYLAVYGLSWGIATTAAPVTATQLLAHAGVAALWVGTAGLCLALAVAQLLVVGPLVGRAPRPRAAADAPAVRVGSNAGTCFGAGSSPGPGSGPGR